MIDRPKLLILTNDPSFAASVRDCTDRIQRSATLHVLSNLAMALARARGGDINAIVVDWNWAETLTEPVEPMIGQLRSVTGDTRIVIAGQVNGEVRGLLEKSKAVVCAREFLSGEITIALQAARDSAPSTSSGQFRPPEESTAKTIGFIGVKGGVGTTSVAANTAAALAAENQTILAEAGSCLHTLPFQLRTCIGTNPGGNMIGAALGVEIPRLDLRTDFGSAEFVRDRREDKITSELAKLRYWAQFVVLDLGANITEAVRHVLLHLDFIGIVLDRDAISIPCGEKLVQVLSELGVTSKAGTIIVNRSSLVCPRDVETIEIALGVPKAAVIPPAADLFCAAVRARRPVVLFDPNSISAHCFVTFAQSLTGGTTRRATETGSNRSKPRPQIMPYALR